MSERNKLVVDQINEAFFKGNFEGFLHFCRDDVRWTIVGDRTVNGKDAIREWMNSMAAEHSELPKFTATPPTIAEGDFVVARGDMTMKDKEGKEGRYSYCDVYRFDGEKIAELTSFVVNTEPKSRAAGSA